MTDEEIVRRLAAGEDPWKIDPEYGCTNPLTGYYPAQEVADYLANPITARVDILPLSDGRHEVRVTVDSKVITVIEVPDGAMARRVLDDLVEMAQSVGGQLQ